MQLNSPYELTSTMVQVKFVAWEPLRSMSIGKYATLESSKMYIENPIYLASLKFSGSVLALKA